MLFRVYICGWYIWEMSFIFKDFGRFEVLKVFNDLSSCILNQKVVGCGCIQVDLKVI